MSTEKIIFVSSHAHIRMLERQITRADAESTIRTPDLIEPAKRGRIRAKKRFGDNILHVFYKETPTAIIFVTGYWRKK